MRGHPSPISLRWILAAIVLAIAAHGCASGIIGTAPPPAATVPDFLGADSPKPEILFLGVFHFADAGLDAYKPKFSLDIRAPERQAQLAGLVDDLARFRPTRVAVEWPLRSQRRLDSLYTEYLADRYKPGVNEIFQIGFRLARQLGHQRIYAIDAQGRSYFASDSAERLEARRAGLNIDSIMPTLANDPWDARFKQLYANDDSLKTVRTLRQTLLYINSPERLRIGHGHYMTGFYKVDRDTSYVGVDDATRWYNRNLRIFNNLQRLADSPADRVLVIIGAGHLPILKFVAGASPEYRLREPSEFLQAR